MTVRFKRPAAIGRKLILEGWVVGRDRRVVVCESVLRDEAGTEIASAKGKLVLTKAPPDLRRLNAAIPDDLRIVVATAIEKDRDRRYQTALDLAEELRRVRCFEPILAKPAGPILRLRRWAQRSPVLATAIGGLFAVLSVGLAIALVLLAQVTKERNDKEAALKDITGWASLGELTLLRTLVAEAEKLWPIAASTAPAMKAWIDQASGLASKLPEHERFLASLRASALPYTEEDRAADLPLIPRLQE
jgi:hypothetical protein